MGVPLRKLQKLSATFDMKPELGKMAVAGCGETHLQSGAHSVFRLTPVAAAIAVT